MEIRGPRTARCEIFPIGTVRSEILKSQNLTTPEPMKIKSRQYSHGAVRGSLMEILMKPSNFVKT